MPWYKQVARVFWEQVAIKGTRLKPANTDWITMILAVSKNSAFFIFCLCRVVTPLFISRYLVNIKSHKRLCGFGIFYLLTCHFIVREGVGNWDVGIGQRDIFLGWDEGGVCIRKNFYNQGHLYMELTHLKTVCAVHNQCDLPGLASASFHVSFSSLFSLFSLTLGFIDPSCGACWALKDRR